jgi:hypothetical protein
MSEHIFSVPLAKDRNGFIDRECPAEDCLFVFKVNCDDWEKLFRDEEVFCPQCRHSAPANTWNTHAQLQHLEEEARNYMEREVHKMLEGVARDFNQRQPRNSFITMSMKVSGGSYRSYVLPAPAIESFELCVKCAECGARFAVIGSAFFCPCCGHSSAEQMFDRSLEKTCAKFENVEKMRSLLEQAGQKNEAADICRSLVESCLSDLVGALQRLCEQLYSQLPQAKPAPFNAFQRLTQSSELWRNLIGEGYEEWLGADFDLLKKFYQRRHLLTHREGIVDQQYIERSGDKTYRVGQRIVVTPSDASQMQDLISKIATRLRKQCAPRK